MIGKKRPWFRTLARAYLRRRLRREFSDVKMKGLSSLRDLVSEGPVLLAVNHVAWWDPLLMVHLDGVLDSDAYALMDRKNLSDLPFFSWVGALPLDKENFKASIRDLKSAAEVLQGAGRMLVIFPHGDQRAAHLPLEFKNGVSFLARLSGAPVVPLALRYDFEHGPQATVRLAAGPALRFEGKGRDAELAFTRQIEDGVAEQLLQIDADLLEDSGRFESLVGRRPPEAPHQLPSGAGALARLAKKEQS